ncbi:Ankyrin repeat domain-containing protein 26 [Camelus dromedarius]|uniref:Ankyrin repeat domain-containing protein 26 n=1 Tax=Camelus dromedarius TaxID=9838 RepID=A0A5N4CN83_CAMDR|nr:Ankyrin repeat domain-containing protein 26 [Camelus dromedarius]
MDFELSDPKDNSEVLPQQIPEAGSQFRDQEIELHPKRDALRPTTLVLECVCRDQGQAQCSNKETESLSQSKQGKVNQYIGKQAFLKERPFLDHMGKLEAMSKRVLMLEEGNKELINEYICLKDRLYQYETDRAEMEVSTQQEN